MSQYYKIKLFSSANFTTLKSSQKRIKNKFSFRNLFYKLKWILFFLT